MMHHESWRANIFAESTAANFRSFNVFLFYDFLQHNLIWSSLKAFVYALLISFQIQQSFNVDWAHNEGKSYFLISSAIWCTRWTVFQWACFPVGAKHCWKSERDSSVRWKLCDSYKGINNPQWLYYGGWFNYPVIEWVLINLSFHY